MLLGAADGVCDEPRQVMPVDAYPTDASPYGVIGMAGNVQEWVADWKGLLFYETGPTVDPTGPESAEPEFPFKVLRGAYYGSGPPGFRISLRRWGYPEDRLQRAGVRCASTIIPTELNDPLEGLTFDE